MIDKHFTILMLILTILGSMAVAQPPAEPLSLWYRQPAKQWVDGFADHFSAIVAIDESSKDDSKGRFRVYNGDFFSNRILWDSGQMRKDSPAREIDIEVKGVQCLMLVFEGDEVLGNWADARVISQSKTD